MKVDKSGQNWLKLNKSGKSGEQSNELGLKWISAIKSGKKTPAPWPVILAAQIHSTC